MSEASHQLPIAIALSLAATLGYTAIASAPLITVTPIKAHAGPMIRQSLSCQNGACTTDNLKKGLVLLSRLVFIP